MDINLDNQGSTVTSAGLWLFHVFMFTNVTFMCEQRMNRAFVFYHKIIILGLQVQGYVLSSPKKNLQ